MGKLSYHRLELLLKELREHLNQNSPISLDSKKQEIAKELRSLMSNNNCDVDISFQERREREKSLQAIGAAVRILQLNNEFAAGTVQGLLNGVQRAQ